MIDCELVGGKTQNGAVAVHLKGLSRYWLAGVEKNRKTSFRISAHLTYGTI